VFDSSQSARSKDDPSSRDPYCLQRSPAKSDPLSRRKSDPAGVILFNLPFSAAGGGARYLFWLLSIIGVPVTVSELWPAVVRQAPASLAAACRDTCFDVRLPAVVNAGAFVEVALSVADLDFEPGSGAPGPVLCSAHIIAPYKC